MRKTLVVGMLIALVVGVLAISRMASGAQEIPLRAAELVSVQDPVLRPFGDAELSSAETIIGGTATLMAYDADEDLLHLVSGEAFGTVTETHIETRDGTTLELLSSITFDRPVLSIAAGDGYLFVVDLDFVTQFDSVGNEVRVVDFPTAPTLPVLDSVPAVAQGRLWFAAPPELRSMDLDTGAITNHELGKTIRTGLTVRPVPLNEGLLLLQQAGGRWVVDISGPTPAVVADWGGTPGASHLTADGRVLVSYAQASLKQVPDNLKELSLVDGTVVEEVTIPDRLLGYDTEILWGSGLLLDPVFGQGLNFHNARTGAWLGSAAPGHNIMNLLATEDGDRVYVLALNHHTNRTSVFSVDLRPRILAVDSVSYSPSETGAIVVDGIALGPNLIVWVNGEERPHQVVRTGDSDTDLAIEIRLDQNDTEQSAIVEVTTDLGTTNFALPTS